MPYSSHRRFVPRPTDPQPEWPWDKPIRTLPARPRACALSLGPPAYNRGDRDSIAQFAAVAGRSHEIIEREAEAANQRRVLTLSRPINICQSRGFSPSIDEQHVK